MPISQSRMLALINECEDISSAMESMAKDIATALQSGNLSPTQKLTVIGATIAMPRPRPFYMLIEKRHFNSHAKRNDRLREKMYAKRHAYSDVATRQTRRVAEEHDRPDYSHLQEELRTNTPPGVSPFEEGKDDDTATPCDDSAPSVNPPRPAFWDKPEPRVASMTPVDVEQVKAAMAIPDRTLAMAAVEADDAIANYHKSQAMLADEFPEAERKRMLQRAGKLPLDDASS